MSARAPWPFLDALLALLLLCTGLPPARAAAGDAPAGAGEPEPIIVGLVLNATQLADAQLLYRPSGPGQQPVWVPEAEATAWRMDIGARARRRFEGVAHAAFCTTVRDKCTYDEGSALLTIVLDSADLLPLFIAPGTAGTEPPAEPPTTGGYLNYDVSAWQIGGPGAAALLEGSVYSPRGHGLLRLGGVATSDANRRTLAQGLWQVDDVARGVSAQLGSIVIPDTALAAGVPVTGLRIGSNARLRPTVSNTLWPQIGGVALRSVRTDVFLDGLFRQTAQVPYGGYILEVQPATTGRGSIDLLATDVTGVQTRTTLQYYQAPQMLNPGATEWSADIGRLAADGRFVTADAPVVASMAVRRGLSRSGTGQGQWLLGTHAARMALSYDSVHPLYGLSRASMVWQQTPAQPDGRMWLGVEHEYLARDVSAAVKVEQAVNTCSADVATSPLSDRLYRPCRRVALLFGADLAARWSSSVSIDSQREVDGRRADLATLGARWQASARSQLALTLQRANINGVTGTSLQISWSQPLGNDVAAQVAMQHRQGQPTTAQWSTQALAPTDAGTGVRRLQAYGSTGLRSTLGARLEGRAEQFDMRGEAWTDPRGVSASGGVSGALGWAEGRVFTSRRIDDAFVVVDVGLPNLPVLLDNREVARTNAQGWAVVTGARAHQGNSVGVDTSTLPIEFSLPRDQQIVVPATAAGVLARFDVSDGGVAVPVLDAQGQPLPAGAPARVSSQRLATAVTSRSEVFLERSDVEAEVVIEVRGKRCRFNYQPQAEPEGGYRCDAQ